MKVSAIAKENFAMPRLGKSLVHLSLALCFSLGGTFVYSQQVLAQATQAQQEVGGIGVTLQTDEKTKQLVIQSVISGGPADKAGLKARDIILEVDGKKIYGESQEQIISRIRGVIGTFVKLKVQKREKVSTLDIIRGEITKTTADQLLDEGTQAYSQSNYPDAIEKWNQALKLFISTSDKQGEGLVYGNLCLVYTDMGKYQKVIDYGNKRLKIVVQIGSKLGEGQVYGDLGNAYLLAGNYKKAVGLFNKQLRTTLQIKDKRGEGDSYGNLGNTYYLQKDYQKAIDFNTKALRILQISGDTRGQGFAYNNLGKAYEALSYYQEASKYYMKSLQVATKRKDIENRNDAYRNLAQINLFLGNYQKVIEFQNKLLQVALQISDKEEQARIYCNLSTTYILLGNYRLAILYGNKSFQVASKIGNSQLESWVYGNLIAIYNDLGDYRKAIMYGNKSLKIGLKIKEKETERNAYGNLGNTYNYLGNYQKALYYYSKALQIDIQNGDEKFQGKDYFSLGNAYYYLGDYKNALEYENKSLKIAIKRKDKRDENSAYSSLGTIVAKLGFYQKAIEFHNKALQSSILINHKLGEGRDHINLGNAYEHIMHYDEALMHQQKAVNVLSAIGARGSLFYAKWAIARTLISRARLFNSKVTAQKHQLQYAIDAFEEAISLIEDTRSRLQEDRSKASFFENKMDVYDDYIRLLITTGNTDRSLTLTEQARARALVDLLNSRYLQPKSSTSQDEEKIRILFAQLTKVPASAKSTPTENLAILAKQRRAVQELQQTNQELSQKDLEVASHYLAPKISLEAIRQIAAQQNATIVQYHLLPKRDEDQPPMLLVWVITAQGKISFHKTNLAEFEKSTIQSLDNLLSETEQQLGISRSQTLIPLPSGKSNKSATLPTLYKLLIEPIKALLPKDPGQKVIFVPHQSLYVVPFAALVDSNGQALVENHTISYAPSIQTLQFTRLKLEQSNKAKTLGPLIVANPTMPKDDRNLFPLAGAQQEGQELGNLLGVKPISGEQATETTIKALAQKASVLHFATHGGFEVKQPLDSWIAFKPDKENDGYLTAAEVFGMQLSARMVVLSACQSAQGKVTGDGVLGLSRAFISAGVPTILVTQWSVNDASTAYLMEAFYKLVGKGEDRARALRQAMLLTKKKYPDPRLWAAFVLIGEG
jgi:CHAT domain-containing protein